MKQFLFATAASAVILFGGGSLVLGWGAYKLSVAVLEATFSPYMGGTK